MLRRTRSLSISIRIDVFFFFDLPRQLLTTVAYVYGHVDEYSISDDYNH